MSINSLDCVVIGYNELPFEQYERFLRNYGEESEAYRDLKFSFVNVAGSKLDYPGLLNYAVREAYPAGGGGGTPAEFRSGDIPNLAAVYLTNFLRRHGFRADYINLFQHEKDRLAALLAEDPLCVAITTTFYVVNLPVNEMVEFIRQHNPRTKIVVGGPLIANHVRNYQGDALKPALADIGADVYVIEGAGELTLAGVVSCLKEGGDLAAVPNIAYFEGSHLRRTATRPENNSLDEDVVNWLDFADQRLGRTIQTRTARSCAFKCSFCNYPTRAGALTLASTEAVERELNSIRELGDARNVVFIDDTFNVPLPRFKDLCRMMIRNGYGFNWFSYFRCSNSDEEAFDLMAESGCKGVFLGIESGSPAILKNMNKAATIERYGYGIDQLHRRGILTFGSFIVGFPGETAETVDETLNFIKENKPTYYRAQSWYCEPGTPVDQQREKYGIEGEGFVWSHNTMDSLEAMDHIDRMFLSVNESLWLPQWSFDFWIIPYLIGRGVTPEGFKEFMTLADRLLGTEIAAVPEAQKRLIQQQNMQGIVNAVRNWNLK
ncbi:MAG TPA: PhpK family radical SAM P-methyltransferase [Pyrinomonadaceae bacterium]|jgi:p-methyltransferase